MSLLSLVARGRRPAPSALRSAPTSATELAAEIEGGSRPLVDSEIPGTATSTPRPAVPVVDPSPRSSAPAPSSVLGRALRLATPDPAPARPAVATPPAIPATSVAPVVTPSRPGDVNEVAPPRATVLPEVHRDDSTARLRAALDLVSRAKPPPHPEPSAETFLEPPPPVPVPEMPRREADSGAELRVLLDRGQREVTRLEALASPAASRYEPRPSLRPPSPGRPCTPHPFPHRPHPPRPPTSTRSMRRSRRS